MTETDLQDVLAFLRREPPHHLLGGALTVYPNQSDDQRRLYEMLIELERRGLAVRVERAPGQALFVAAPSESRSGE